MIIRLLRLCVTLTGLGLATAAYAEGGGTRPPFGAGPVAIEAAPSATLQTPGGITGWLMARQFEVQRDLGAAVRGLRSADPVAAGLTLAVISFVYGVLHAAGPGHGKAIISSYVLANRQTLRRGILLSFMAAFFQACSAIALFGIVVLAIRATSIERKTAEWTLEIISWTLVTGIGLWMLYKIAAPLVSRGAPAPAGDHGHVHDPGCGHDHGHDHGHGHGHDHPHGPACGHDHEPAHVHDANCGHVHLPGPKQLAGPWSWRRATSLALSVGIRPCTGAIGVLSVASLQGLLWAGVLSTFVMALGTAITVSAMAAMAAGSRQAALTWGGKNALMAQRIEFAASLIGAALVTVFGGIGLLWSLNGPAPF